MCDIVCIQFVSAVQLTSALVFSSEGMQRCVGLRQLYVTTRLQNLSDLGLTKNICRFSNAWATIQH